jgi:hypothetical protein
MFEKCRIHQKLKYCFRTGAFVGLYCIIVLGIVLVLSRVLYMISGRFNIKVMFLCSIFMKRKEYVPVAAKSTSAIKLYIYLMKM